uniref:Large ribosomal subunit protein uL4m n=1 Tax=Erythrolobus australicus TaxID=1077150 RepID=A0A7S1TLZ6_9RHOD
MAGFIAGHRSVSNVDRWGRQARCAMGALQREKHTFSHAPAGVDLVVNSTPRIRLNDPAVNVVIPDVEQRSMLEHSSAPIVATQFGGDREALVYRSLYDFVPTGATMLSGRMFNAPIREDIVHTVVKWQLLSRRAGTASTKSRAEVSYSGRKIAPQKGRGRARHGDRGAPLFRGGGRSHGPKPRDWSYPLNKNVRRNGLRSALTSKYAAGRLWIVQTAELPPDAKSQSDLVDAMVRLGFESTLVIDWDHAGERKISPHFEKAAFKLENVLAMPPNGLNCYDMLSFQHLIISLPALHKLERRFLKYTSLC